MSVEYIEIPNCPMCHGQHRYKLEVDRSVIFKMNSMFEINESPRQERYTRLFTCPVRNENFQATLVLTDTSFDRIKDVQVVRIASEDEE